VQQRTNEFIYDSEATDEAAVRIGPGILAELEDGLEDLGFQIVADEAYGVIAVHVVDSRHVGTAYVEFKNGGVELRILLARDGSPEHDEATVHESGNGTFALRQS
jgi:hypothetical protein